MTGITIFKCGLGMEFVAEVNSQEGTSRQEMKEIQTRGGADSEKCEKCEIIKHILKVRRMFASGLYVGREKGSSMISFP